MNPLRVIPAAHPCEDSMPNDQGEAQAEMQTRNYGRIPRAERVAAERWDDEGGAGAGGRPQAPDLPGVG